MIEKDKIASGEFKNIKKSRNKIVEILAKSKNQNLSKFRSGNWFKSKNFQSIGTIKELNFFILNVKITFTKLR